jgi:hypothetical protein
VNELYVLTKDSELVGVYTTHRKATQALIMDTIKEGMKLQDYSFEFGVEFFTYIGPESGLPFLWEIQEVTPDARA